MADMVAALADTGKSAPFVRVPKQTICVRQEENKSSLGQLLIAFYGSLWGKKPKSSWGSEKE
jgi:hypothetical protein